MKLPFRLVIFAVPMSIILWGLMVISIQAGAVTI